MALCHFWEVVKGDVTRPDAAEYPSEERVKFIVSLITPEQQCFVKEIAIDGLLVAIIATKSEAFFKMFHDLYINPAHHKCEI